MVVAHQLLPKPRGDLRQADLDLGQELDVGDQQEMYERHPDLRHHRVLAYAEEGPDLQVLLYPLEEQLYLPSPLVDCGDGRGSQPEVVGQEDVVPVRLLVVEHHAPQFPGIRLLGVLKLQLHHVVGHDAQFFVWGEVQSDNLEPCVLPEPCDEESAFAVNLLEPCVVAVSLVVGVDAVRFNPEPLPRRADVGHLPVAHHHVAGQIAGQVQLRVELDRTLVPAVTRPVVYGKTERDGRAVDGVERVVEAEAMPGGQFRAPGQQLVEQGLEHGRVAPVHGVRERRLRDRLHAKVVEPAPVGQQTVADLAQRVLACNLGIEAGEELPPCGEVLAVAVRAARLGSLFETMSGYELEKLGKDGIVLHCSRIWLWN